jgi:hypothetical protein
MVARFCLLVLQAALLTTVFPIPSEAATILVPSQQPTIQDGISAAAAGDTVLIAPGIHFGAGNRDISFLGKDVVVMSEQGPESTTVDCEALGRGFLIAGSRITGRRGPWLAGVARYTAISNRRFRFTIACSMAMLPPISRTKGMVVPSPSAFSATY